MRLFIALDITDAIRDRISLFVAASADSRPTRAGPNLNRSTSP